MWTPAQLVEVLGAEDGAWAAELLGGDPAGHVRARHVDAAAARRARTTPARWERVRGRAARRARAARPQPAGTTRWSPRGTGWRSPHWPRPARVRTARTGSRPRRRRPSCCCGCTWSTAGCAARPATAWSARRAGVLEDYALPRRGPARAAPGHRGGALAAVRPTACWTLALERFADPDRRAPSSTPPTTPRRCPPSPRPDRQRDPVGRVRAGRRAARRRRCWSASAARYRDGGCGGGVCVGGSAGRAGARGSPGTG